MSVIYRGNIGSNAMLCFRSISGVESGEFLRLFYVQFPDVRSFKDSRNDLSGDFLPTTLKRQPEVALSYTSLKSAVYNNPVVSSLLSTHRVCAALVLESAGSCNRKGLFMVCFCFFSSCSLHFHICFLEG